MHMTAVSNLEGACVLRGHIGDNEEEKGVSCERLGRNMRRRRSGSWTNASRDKGKPSTEMSSRGTDAISLHRHDR